MIYLIAVFFMCVFFTYKCGHCGSSDDVTHGSVVRSLRHIIISAVLLSFHKEIDLYESSVSYDYRFFQLAFDCLYISNFIISVSLFTYTYPSSKSINCRNGPELL